MCLDADFPTAQTLREANVDFSRKASRTVENNDENPAPRPAVRTKEEVFVLSNFTNIDERACKVKPCIV